MGKDPSMPFYVNDWLSSSVVSCMTLEQQGAYVRLLCFCWASQTVSIPDDDATLAKLSGMNEGWFNGGSTLVRNCFEPNVNRPGFLTNMRMQKLWKEREVWRMKSAEAGRKSGESRRKARDRRKKRTNEPPLNQPSDMVQTKCEPKSNSSSSLSSSSSKDNTTHTLLTLESSKKEREDARASVSEPRHTQHTISLVGKVKLPPRIDAPELREVSRDWCEHFFHKTGARTNTIQLETALMGLCQNGWDTSRIVKSIQFSISSNAAKFLDPANNWDQPKVKTRAEHMATPARDIVKGMT